MITPTTDSTSDHSDLVNKVLELIPEQTWHLVMPAIVTHIVDSMTSDVLKRLTGNAQGFDSAEEILLSYYTQDNDGRHSLITDAFKLLGTEYVLYLLDSMQLDKYMEFQQTIEGKHEV